MKTTPIKLSKTTYVHYFLHYKNNKPTFSNNELPTKGRKHSLAMGEHYLPAIFLPLRNSYYKRVFSSSRLLFSIFLQQFITLPKMRKAWEYVNDERADAFFIFWVRTYTIRDKNERHCMDCACKTSINGIMISFTRFRAYWSVRIFRRLLFETSTWHLRAGKWKDKG